MWKLGFRNVISEENFTGDLSFTCYEFPTKFSSKRTHFGVPTKSLNDQGSAIVVSLVETTVTRVL